jgi:hypothetical protein
MNGTDGASALSPQIDHSPEPEEVPEPAQPEPAQPEAAQPEPARSRIVRRARRGAGATAPATAPAVTADPAPPVETPPSGKKVPRKVRRQDRKLRALMARIEATDDEVVLASIDGTSGFRPVALLVTNFRVALVPHNKGLPARWIPLEEVNKIWHSPGASNARIDASIEVLRLGSRRAHRLGEAITALREAVKEARSGNETYHHPALVQHWCDRTAALSDSEWLRFKVWVQHNPKVKLLGLTPLMPLAYALLQRSL